MYQGPGAADRFSLARAVVRPSVVAFQWLVAGALAVRAVARAYRMLQGL